MKYLLIGTMLLTTGCVTKKQALKHGENMYQLGKLSGEIKSLANEVELNMKNRELIIENDTLKATCNR